MFISIILFTTFIFPLHGMRGEPLDKIYIQLSENLLLDQCYARSLMTDRTSNHLMCAMKCSQHEMCTLFQFKDGKCQLFKQETHSGINIISLNNMTEVWRLDIGKETITLEWKWVYLPHHISPFYSYFKSTFKFKNTLNYTFKSDI